ncbi:unnamed protein product [Ectocarpus sp. 8 AP-2014]
MDLHACGRFLDVAQLCPKQKLAAGKDVGWRSELVNFLVSCVVSTCLFLSPISLLLRQSVLPRGKNVMQATSSFFDVCCLFRAWRCLNDVGRVEHGRPQSSTKSARQPTP